ncbi:hypothetical protein DXV75_00205 [Alteromonas aestuariivivens]|uniref:Uncharacterized protein n=2 Tax=Alteromonas aestuariivivens TaxID=1938339 RepID=A0A3D8MDK1_9ALTE|nr:hypothetical protein DXV75_00205 [Alteromonas aestuariivivens]
MVYLTFLIFGLILGFVEALVYRKVHYFVDAGTILREKFAKKVVISLGFFLVCAYAIFVDGNLLPLYVIAIVFTASMAGIVIYLMYEDNKRQHSE